MQQGENRGDRADRVDRRTLLRRTALLAAAGGVAVPTASARAGALPDAVQHVGPSGDDSADGRTPATARRSWQMAIDALPASGGLLIVAAGLHRTAAPVAVRGKAVSIVATPGAVLRAAAPMEALLTYERVVDAPGAGIDGLTLDLAGLARRGLLILDCWQTEQTVRAIGLAGGTAVHIRTENPDFGCYYNRVRVKCVPQVGADGGPVAGSTGVHIEGVADRNRTNHNTIVDSRIGNVETGILVGAFTDANTVVRTDCTACGVAYDLRSGETHLMEVWEEGNARGFVVRNGAAARVSALYAEKWETEGDGLLHHNRGVIAGPEAIAPVERVHRAEGGIELRERWQPREARLSWIAVDPDGSERELLAVDAHTQYRHGIQQQPPSESCCPPAPEAPEVRVFVRTTRTGTTELCARLPTGRVVVLARDVSDKKSRRKRSRRPRRRATGRN